MKRAQQVLVVLLALLAVGSVASAATIYDVMANQLADPEHWYDAGYGQSGYTLMWSEIDPDGKTLLTTTGRPTGSYTGSWADNPGWLDFQQTSSGGGGGGTGGGTGNNIGTYTIAATDGVSRRFNFSTLFYDPGLDAAIGDGDLAVRITLTGSLGTTLAGTAPNMKELTGLDVRKGTMVTFNVLAEAGETLGVTIESIDTYAAGFFLDTITVAPEPATLSLLGLGLAGLVLRRRK